MSEAARLRLVVEHQGARQVYPLRAARVTVGRSAQNAVTIDDDDVSRQHCELVRDGRGRLVVRDLESRNGTRVNGQTVTEAPVGPGDRIEVGPAVLAIEPEEAPAAPGEDRLAALLDVVGAVASLGSPGELAELLPRAADAMLAATGAENAVLLLAEDESEESPGADELAVGAARDADGRDLGAEPAISRSIVADVVARTESVCVVDTERSGDAARAESIARHGIRSVMAAPLLASGHLLGVAYLDARIAIREFDANDLRFFEAIAAQVAIAIENARLQRAALAAERRRRERVEAENEKLRATLAERGHILGASPAIDAVRERLRKVAPTDATVLITGENGTGKEAFARALHDLGERRDGPFVVVNCAAIPDTLIESELFGHEKGAFTGAHDRRIGKFERADEGTIFLDEVGELGRDVQAKLLRVLQEREVERLGGARPIAVDVRVVAATNRDLKELAAQGEFREDLYFRLCVVGLTIPPLRERGEDVVLLARHFIAAAAAEHGRPVPELTRGALTALRAHPFPGNVRELQNRVRQAVIMADGPRITAADLELAVPGEASDEGATGCPTLAEARAEAEIRAITEALRLHGGVVVRAAEHLGVSRVHLRKLMNRHGIERER